MKTIVVLVLIASGIGSSLSEVSDETFMEKLNDKLKYNEYASWWEQLLERFFYPSFDRKCILDRYKEKNITEILIADDRSHVIFLSVATTCSSKLDLLLETVFDLVMSLHPLVKAFIDDSQFDEYLQMLICANRHAVESNILDSSVYDFKHEVSPQNQGECNDLIDLTNDLISDSRLKIRKETERPCSIRIASTVEKILIKNVLLVQVELTEQHKNQERSTFVMQTRQVLQDILTCALQNPRPN
jgi:hypothetical protein